MRRRCLGLRMITWSRHSRRIEPITRYVGILPRAERTRHDLGDAEAGDPPPHLLVVDAVPVSQKPSGSGVLREGVDQLLGGPRRGGVLGHVDVHDAAAVMRDQHEHEEHAARQGRDGEEIRRNEGGEVVGEEGPPWLRRRTRQPRQQSRHRTRGDLNAQLPELAVDARGAPQRIGAGHVGEESGDGRVERGATGAVAS